MKIKILNVVAADETGQINLTVFATSKFLLINKNK